MTPVKKALISVYDKTGIVSFAKFLHGAGVEILSTGGTAELLKKQGIPVKEVSSVTQVPEMLDGRVKTLHPNIHAGLLALRDNPEHMKTLHKYGIEPIDLLVVNLYPFAETVKTQTDELKIIEMIDIGGPAMLRSAAKNYRHVAVISDPEDYQEVETELLKNHLVLSPPTLKALAGKVFHQTASYDRGVAGYFAGKKTFEGKFPLKLALEFEKAEDLRYGENPHQKAALYRKASGAGQGVVGAKKIQGKELSFNNFLDLDAACDMAEAFQETACSIVKHTSPCGFALGKDSNTAFKNAYLCDPLSAFGSVIGFNTEVDARTAKSILESGFVECVIARSFDAEALKTFGAKKNLRLLSTGRGPHERDGLDFKKIGGGLLLQEPDQKDPASADLKFVTKKRPTAGQIKDLLFAFKVCRYVKSNAIVIAKKGVTLGLGMGQPSRVDSCHTAFKKAGKRAKGAVLASDGFFPKPDSILLARRFGIGAIIQPGGSIQDETIIQACDKAGIAMVFTGVRHFKH